MDFKKLDKVFSEWIRRRDADEYGRVKCCTCDTVLHWAEMDCGHFVRRSHMATRWYEDNCHAQCKTCNRVNDGEELAHGVYIIERHGKEVLDALMLMKRLYTHWMQFEIDNMAKTFKEKIRQL